jgi:hypothetical protein
MGPTWYFPHLLFPRLMNGHNVSKTGPTLMGPLEGSKLNDSLSKGPNRVDVSRPPPPHIQFSKLCVLVFRIPDDQQSPET